MYTNSELIDGLIRNDPKVIKNIYSSQFPIILNWIRKNSGNSDDANDVFQEALLIVLRKLKTDCLTLDCSFSTYLFSICKHLWFQEIRTRARFQVNLNGEFNEIADCCHEKELEEARFRIFLRNLNLLEAKCIQLLLLYCKEKTLSEIKSRMGFRNTQAVADKKKNCRKALIKYLLNCKEYRELDGEVYVKN